jgi:hypothetical protein
MARSGNQVGLGEARRVSRWETRALYTYNWLSPPAPWPHHRPQHAEGAYA